MQTEQHLPASNGQSTLPKAETITELAERHLHDEHHTTTDEEIRNARVEVTDSVETDDENLYVIDHTTVLGSDEDTSDRGSEDEDDDNDNETDKRSKPNPYDILSS